VARWRRRRPFVGTAHAPASVHPAPVRSTAQERNIYGVFQLVFHKVQYTNPGLACTPDQAKSGCWAPQADRREEKTWSSRAGSKDSQWPRGWTQDEPGNDLHAGSMAKEEQLVESLLIKQIADWKKNSSSCLLGRAFLTTPGTRDWSIVRVCNSSPPMGCWHVLLTDSVRSLGGGWLGGGKEEEDASRYTTTV